jgi:hypothetical protein
MTIHQFKFLVPLFPAGQEPLPSGISEEERPQYEQNKKIEKYMGMGAESCAFKSVTAGVFGSCPFWVFIDVFTRWADRAPTQGSVLARSSL